MASNVATVLQWYCVEQYTSRPLYKSPCYITPRRLAWSRWNIQHSSYSSNMLGYVHSYWFCSHLCILIKHPLVLVQSTLECGLSCKENIICTMVYFHLGSMHVLSIWWPKSMRPKGPTIKSDYFEIDKWALFYICACFLHDSMQISFYYESHR